MAFDLNRMQIIGRLGRDPEMRYTKQGTAITTFTVAVGGKWTDHDGNERGDETEWFRVDAWGARNGSDNNGLAGLCNQYLTKGQQVYVEGRFKTDKWTDRDGNARTTNKIIASNVVFLGSKGERTGGGDVSPQSTRPHHPQSVEDNPQSVEDNMSDDGIPF